MPPTSADKIRRQGLGTTPSRAARPEGKRKNLTTFGKATTCKRPWPSLFYNSHDIDKELLRRLLFILRAPSRLCNLTSKTSHFHSISDPQASASLPFCFRISLPRPCPRPRLYHRSPSERPSPPAVVVVHISSATTLTWGKAKPPCRASAASWRCRAAQRQQRQKPQ